MNVLKIAPSNQEDLVHTFTRGRTTHVSEMEEMEGDGLYGYLRAMNNKRTYANDPKDKQRKAVIAIFRRKGKTAADAIAWAEKRGVNGLKKKFNDYDGQELYQLTIAAEKFVN